MRTSPTAARATNFTTIDVLAALDSNFMIYAEDMFADPRRETALALLEIIPVERIVVPVQAAGEVLNWLVRKARVPKALAAERTLGWLQRYTAQPTTERILVAAGDLAATHDLQVWDAVILAAAAEAEADVLLSEDMHHRFAWRGVTVVNPFRGEPDSLLQKLSRR